MSDSWEAFAQALLNESTSLGRLNDSARKLTSALVENSTLEIETAERTLDACRIEHQKLVATRRGMQVRGFGTMSLRDLCAYAPRNMAYQFNQRLAEITYGTTSLSITNNNNKALILGGMQRLMNVTSLLQRSSTENTGTYKRRGFATTPNASVLVSSKC
ncbi:MAG: hypothetical protein ABR584_12805 [Candidatus Baltobacteraceae bacterium]